MLVLLPTTFQQIVSLAIHGLVMGLNDVVIAVWDKLVRTLLSQGFINKIGVLPESWLKCYFAKHDFGLDTHL